MPTSDCTKVTAATDKTDGRRGLPRLRESRAPNRQGRDGVQPHMLETATAQDASRELAASTSPGVCSPVLECAVSDELLRAFVQAYWLRPENAYWMALRSASLGRVPITAPSADISCGDGVFSFLHAGGRFEPRFDVFAAAGRLDRISREHADMFDVQAAGYSPPIARRPDRLIDLATDLKPALLRKAAALGLYGRLIEHDNNQALPIADGALRWVYCNSAYWVREIDSFLRELARTLADEGRLILQVKLARLRDCTLEKHRDVLGAAFLDLIGRGRVACWPTLTDRAGWERRFGACGLEIIAARPFVTSTHARIWDVGLRPIAPLLVRMANALDAGTRASIQRDWTDLMMELLRPLCREDLCLSPGDGEPVEIQYELRAAR